MTCVTDVDDNLDTVEFVTDVAAAAGEVIKIDEVTPRIDVELKPSWNVKKVTTLKQDILKIYFLFPNFTINLH